LTLAKTGTYTHHVAARSKLTAFCALAVLLSLVKAHAQAIPRSVYVTILDEGGSPVPDLGPSDFIVREDNVSREILKVAPADDPMQIAILVDNSQASSGFIRDLRVGLESFVTDMTNGTKHELSIVALAERPTILTETTSDRQKLLKGIGRIFDQSNSANYLLDGVIEVCQGFKKREATRPVIVAITTEGPEYSSRVYQDVLKAVRDTGTALNVITLGRPATDTISEEGRNRTAVLEQGPRVSGGARETLLAGSALPGALTRLAAQLNHQYRVTYARPQTLIPPERVTVGATRPGLTARGTPVREPRPQDKK